MDQDLDYAKIPPEDTKESAKIIKAINKDTVHKICSGQVVLNLATAVKELVENSIDAGATVVEIRLKDYGQELVEVSDNGSGVQEENFSGLTLKYHTSKLREFSDLLGVSTFGFRGEALSSLCALSDLVISTRHASTDHGTKITYDHKGHIKNICPCARQIGTTVTLTNIFNTLPVRQKEFHRNIKREFNKMTQLLYAYCIISEGIKITCTNQTSKGNKSIVVATQGSTIRDNIACVFGVKQLQSLLDLKPFYPESYISNMKEKFFSDLNDVKIETNLTPEESIDVADIKSDNELDLSEDSSNDANNIEKSSDVTMSEAYSLSNSNTQKSGNIHNQKQFKQPFDFTGLISSCAHGSGRSTTDRQFFYVNSRPCEPQKVMKIVNEIYKHYNPHQSPFVFIDLKVKRSSVDVNVTPDKRKIFLDREKHLLEVIKTSLNKIYEHIPSTLKVENLGSEMNSLHKSKSAGNNSCEKAPRIFSSFLNQFASKYNNESNSTIVNNSETKRKATTLDNYVNIKSVRSMSPNLMDSDDSHDQSIESRTMDITEDNNEEVLNNENNHNESLENINKNIEKCKDEIINDSSEVSDSRDQSKETVYLGFSTKDNFSQVVELSDVLNDDSKTSSDRRKKMKLNNGKASLKNDTQIKYITDSNSIENKSAARRTCQMNVTFEGVKKLMLEDSAYKENKIKNINRVKFRSEINPVFNKKCEEELEKEISKDMFDKMKIIGQFNLGFIVTQLDEDLFIIDQHATDEKYNFETLQKTTVLTNQKLVIPQTLELTGVNETILIDNLEVCRKNGFTFDIDKDAPPTKRVKLLTIPISNNYVFGKEDIEELLFMLKDAPQQICRPSRVQSMFASRACRKSVMIGTALSKTIMRKLVDHMGQIEQPWNCPHGRPTIRHLANMALLESRS